VNPRGGEIVSRTAENRIVQSEAYTTSSGEIATTDLHPRFEPNAQVAALVARYRAAAEPQAKRVVGTMQSFTAPEGGPSNREVVGQLIADAQLEATRTSGAQIAFMNAGGVRADLDPAAGGSITFGDIYAVQPFGNTMVVRSFTGRQIKAILEQQFASGSNSVEKPNILRPSAGFTFSYDLSRPEGQRIIDPRLNGEPLQDDRSYRVTINSFLASGGDNFTLLKAGTNQVGGPQDLDVLEAYFAAHPNVAPPTRPRVTDATPK
jgi:5'-nucleotidase